MAKHFETIMEVFYRSKVLSSIALPDEEMDASSYEEQILHFLGRPNLTNFQKEGKIPKLKNFKYSWPKKKKVNIEKLELKEDRNGKRSHRSRFATFFLGII